MVEHLVCNQVVVGSNPVASTTLAETLTATVGERGDVPGRATAAASRTARRDRASSRARRRGRKRESTECSARAQRSVIFENEVGCRK